MAAEQNSISFLPDTLPVFPLNAVLYPRWKLPLNIFEPRYLNMFDDANMFNKLIGIIQPLGGSRANPVLAKVGCAGYISDYTKTKDGRYEILLDGIIRFTATKELDVQTPYRQIAADFSAYANDLEAPQDDALPERLRLEAALGIYGDNHSVSLDWDAFARAGIEALIHGLISELPFRPIEKQALLETPDLQARSEALIKLLVRQNDGHDDQLSGPR